MTHSAPRLLRRNAALSFLLSLFTYLVAPSTARAQYVTSTGVHCGDEEISFDTLNVPTEGANAARLKELARIFAHAREAWAACDGTADKYPGCAFVSTWIKARVDAGAAVWQQPRYAERIRLRALDANLLRQATRVLAHKGCADFKEGMPQPCIDLVAAEALAAGRTLCSDPEDEMRERVAGQRNPGEKASVLRDAQKKCAGKPDECSKTPELRRKAEAYEFVDAAAKTVLFYDAPAGCLSKADAATDMNEDLVRQLDAMPINRPVPALPDIAPEPPGNAPLPSPIGPRAGPSMKDLYRLSLTAYYNGPAFAALTPTQRQHLTAYGMLTGPERAVQAELRALRKHEHSGSANRDACRDATFYVAPSGALIQREITSNHITVCVDTSSYAIDRPFEVEVTVYPTRGKNSWIGVPAISQAVWPGEPTGLDLAALQNPPNESPPVSVLRITVRGTPRGVSLRALAQRGEEGSAFDKSYESSELRAQARKVLEAKTALEADLAKAAALDTLASALAREKTLDRAADDADQEIKLAEKDTSKAAGASKKTNDAKKALEDFLHRYGRQPANVDNRAAISALLVARGLLGAIPNSTTTDADKMKAIVAELRRYQSALNNAAAELRHKQSDSANLRDQLDRKLTRLCRISKEMIPVIDEDLLNGNEAKGTYVIDYDYVAGFQRATPRDLQDSDRVYLRVRRVPPRAAVAAVVGDLGVVKHDVSLVGISPSDAGNQNGARPGTLSNGHTRSNIDDLKPEQVALQASSTHILVLPSFDGARRYELKVCRISGATQSCEPAKPASEAPSSAQQTASAAPAASTTPPTNPTRGDSAAANSAGVMSHSTVVVHTQRRLGVRAGVGASIVGGDLRSLVDVAESKSMKYVRGSKVTPGLGVPVLLTFYLTARDAIDFPRGRAWAISAGVDMVDAFKARPKFYAGPVLDLWGFGITLMYALEGQNSVDLQEGRYVSATANVPSTMRFYHGGFIGLTTDLDIFQTVFSKYVLGNPKLPAVGTSDK